MQNNFRDEVIFAMGLFIITAGVSAAIVAAAYMWRSTNCTVPEGMSHDS